MRFTIGVQKLFTLEILPVQQRLLPPAMLSGPCHDETHQVFLCYCLTYCSGLMIYFIYIPACLWHVMRHRTRAEALHGHTKLQRVLAKL